MWKYNAACFFFFGAMKFCLLFNAYMESLLLESIDNFYLITVYLLCLKWHKEINYLSSSIWKSTFISRDKFIRTRRRCWWNPSRIVTLPPHSASKAANPETAAATKTTFCRISGFCNKNAHRIIWPDTHNKKT